MNLPEYLPEQKVIVNGMQKRVICPVFYKQVDAITEEEKPIGWKYRIEGEPYDLEADKISITPDELIKNML